MAVLGTSYCASINWIPFLSFTWPLDASNLFLFIARVLKFILISCDMSQIHNHVIVHDHIYYGFHQKNATDWNSCMLPSPENPMRKKKKKKKKTVFLDERINLPLPV